MAAQICETCKYREGKCYCTPNSTCEGYEPEVNEIDVNLEEQLVQLRKMVQSMYIPNLMNTSDGALREARMQKNEIVKYIDSLRKELR